MSNICFYPKIFPFTRWLRKNKVVLHLIKYGTRKLFACWAIIKTQYVE